MGNLRLRNWTPNELSGVKLVWIIRRTTEPFQNLRISAGVRPARGGVSGSDRQCRHRGDPRGLAAGADCRARAHHQDRARHIGHPQEPVRGRPGGQGRCADPENGAGPNRRDSAAAAEAAYASGVGRGLIGLFGLPALEPIRMLFVHPDELDQVFDTEVGADDDGAGAGSAGPSSPS